MHVMDQCCSLMIVGYCVKKWRKSILKNWSLISVIGKKKQPHHSLISTLDCHTGVIFWSSSYCVVKELNISSASKPLLSPYSG